MVVEVVSLVLLEEAAVQVEAHEEVVLVAGSTVVVPKLRLAGSAIFAIISTHSSSDD